MKKLCIICCSLLLLVNTLYAQKDNSILVGVEYFNGWWKESPNKWERHGKDWRSQYPDRIPLLGEYNSQETMDKEIETASEYGVDFFSILWYYPGQLKDKGACDLLNAGLDQFMNSPNSGKMKFVVELCNHSPFAIITDEDWDNCMDVCVNAMKHASYLRVDGRAVVKIHGGDQFHLDNGSDLDRSSQIIQRMRQKAKEAGVGELLITVGTYGVVPVDSKHVFVQSGIDGTMQYMDPTELPQKETDYSYEILAARAKEMRDLRRNDAISWAPYFPAGWNPRPWGDPRAAFSLPTRKQWKSSLKELKKDLLKSFNLGFPRKDGTTQKAFTIYAWPPYGGTKNFDKFVKGLHDKGNYIGLYASGIGYTIRSNTDTTYNMTKEFEELGLENIMKKAPDGDFSENNVCARPQPGVGQRFGYDMCPTNQFVTDVVVDQVSQMVEKGEVDYIQYFDQNLGGSCYGCYDTSHGHGYGPGAWQAEAMQDLYETLMPVLKSGERKPLLGCEAAAAEPFIPYLLFNDNRAAINFAYGTPVPAYQYVNHEYLNGFMGNQNSFEQTVDINKSPLNMLQRLALAFVSGDMFTVILRGDGDMIETWNSNWDAKIPNQEYMKTLIKNLNEWRKTGGLDYLVTGRMIKPLQFEGTTEIPMVAKSSGLPINFPSVFTSNWQSQDNRSAQFFVNYLPDVQEITIDMSMMKDVKIQEDAVGNSVAAKADKELKITIEPLSTVMVSYTK